MPGARAELANAQGQPVGEVTFTERDGKVVVEGNLRGLPPGFHGFHIHAVGKCDAPFTSAGGHLTVGAQDHPTHAGDQPVVLVISNGTAETRFATDRYKLSDLLPPEGRAIIVHATADNYGNVPSRLRANHRSDDEGHGRRRWPTWLRGDPTLLRAAPPFNVETSGDHPLGTAPISTRSQKTTATPSRQAMTDPGVGEGLGDDAL